MTAFFSNKVFLIKVCTLLKQNAIAHLIDYSKHNFFMHWETKISCDSLDCNIHFIAMVWDPTHNISKVCLYGVLVSGHAVWFQLRKHCLQI